MGIDLSRLAAREIWGLPGGSLGSWNEIAALRVEMLVLADAVAAVALRLEALERPWVALRVESVAVRHAGDAARVNGF